jgi:ketosteroid isomerase-like protein
MNADFCIFDTPVTRWILQPKSLFMKNPDYESIIEFYRAWFGSMEQADIERLLVLLEDDFYLKNPNQPAVKDKKTLKNALVQFFQNYSETIKWEIDELSVFNTSAVVRISEEVILISKKTEKETNLKGVHFSLLIKIADGKWRLKSDIGSLNHPPPSSDE